MAGANWLEFYCDLFVALHVFADVNLAETAAADGAADFVFASYSLFHFILDIGKVKEIMVDELVDIIVYDKLISEEIQKLVGIYEKS